VPGILNPRLGMLARGNPGSRVVVGLGNADREYARTRHNLGAMAVAHAAAQLGLQTRPGMNPIPLTRSGLVLPSGFMNESGGPVRKAVERWHPGADALLIVHDELELPPGAVEWKDGGGHGGHNGLRDIANALGTSAFQRLRLGIGRPPGRMDPAAYVLAPFPASERDGVEDQIAQAAEQIAAFLRGDPPAGST
jgi:PTH1 family peptidyl-tRNA hydrolase